MKKLAICFKHYFNWIVEDIKVIFRGEVLNSREKVSSWKNGGSSAELRSIRHKEQRRKLSAEISRANHNN